MTADAGVGRGAARPRIRIARGGAVWTAHLLSLLAVLAWGAAAGVLPSYLLPGPLKSYLRTHPEIKVGIYRSRLDEIPRQVLDREVDVGFVKDEPIFRELKCVQIHADQMVLIGAPSHPLASRPDPCHIV